MSVLSFIRTSAFVVPKTAFEEASAGAPVKWSNGRPLGDGSFCATWTSHKAPTTDQGQKPERVFRGPALNEPYWAMTTRGRMAPGVFGIRRPVLLLPEGMAERLSGAQLQTVVAHELCHVRRRDNLTGAIHLAVETIFWFHPAVWWIRARLAEERERACDEAVLASGSEPRSYAEGILRFCRMYVDSPRLCVSGIGGGNLTRRIEAILTARAPRAMDWRRRVLLAGAAAAASAQSQATLAFEVASVKANRSGSAREPSMILPGGRFTATNNTLRGLILNAYGIMSAPYLLEGGPGWIDTIDTERYDIDAKAEDNAIPANTPDRVQWEKTRLMLRTLLGDRFKLAIRRQSKEMPVYQLTVAKNGPKLRQSLADCNATAFACHGYSGNRRRFSAVGVDMYDLALM